MVNCYLEAFSPDFFVELVKPAVAYAASKHVTLVLENEAHDSSGTAEGVKNILEQVHSPYFGTTYDPCNYYQANEEPYPGAYEILKEHIRYVHLKGGCRYDPQNRPGDHQGGTLRGRRTPTLAIHPSQKVLRTPMVFCIVLPGMDIQAISH